MRYSESSPAKSSMSADFGQRWSGGLRFLGKSKRVRRTRMPSEERVLYAELEWAKIKEETDLLAS